MNNDELKTLLKELQKHPYAFSDEAAANIAGCALKAINELEDELKKVKNGT